MACEAFISQHPQGNICFLPAWGRAVENALGLKSLYMVAREAGLVCGVLPLMHVRSLLFGNMMVSQAFCNYGGILAQNPEARDALYHYAVKLAGEKGCETIEFRNVDPLPYDLHLRTGKMCMHLPLMADPEELWKSFDPKVRNQIRKAEKSNILPLAGGGELLDDFYDVYTIRMRQLGTPCYSRRLMRTLLEVFPNYCRIFVVKLGELTVGGGITTCFNGFVEIPWAATLVEYNKLSPNNLLYWSVIKHYCQTGARCFDFGRCTVDGGTYQFKKQWDPKPVEMHYQYWVRPGHQLSINSPDNPKYQRKIEAWKKMPLWLTRLIGPYISRSLP